MEVRKQLTEKQFKIVTDVAEKVARAQAALQEQQEKAQMTQALIFEAHEVPEDAKVALDPETKQLIFEVPDAPSKPAKSGKADK